MKRLKRQRAIALACLSAPILALGGCSGGSGGPHSGANGDKIAFVSNRDENSEIYIMNADGSGQTRLTDNAAFDTDPVFNPNQNKIAFESHRDNVDGDIYTMNPDGSNVVRLSREEFGGYSPAFTPDGRQIVFGSGGELVLINSDGSNSRRFNPIEGEVEVPTDFSPDGRNILFTAGTDGSDIYLIKADGSGEVRLTEDGTASSGSFSPDGRKIVFSSERDASSARSAAIYIMNADGSNQTRLTNNPANDSQPIYSRDGKKIIFVSNRDGNEDIYRMNLDGSGQTRLTINQADDASPSS